MQAATFDDHQHVQCIDVVYICHHMSGITEKSLFLKMSFDMSFLSKTFYVGQNGIKKTKSDMVHNWS
jgi:hypothetical protein